MNTPHPLSQFLDADELPVRWGAPCLLPGDVRELVGIYDSILNMCLTIPQRRATEASRARVLGGEPVPDVPAALCQWFAALGAATGPAGDPFAPGGPVVLAGRVVLEEVIRSGEAAGWEPLQGAMQTLATLIATLRTKPSAAPEGAADGPLAEKGSADGLDWYEAEACPFYSLHGEHGDRMRALVVSLRNAPKYVEREIDAPTRIRFEGPPGTGKTLGARWIGRELGMPVAVFRLDAIGSSWRNRTPRNLRACFDTVRERKGLAVLDEIDGLVTRRDKSDESADRHVVTALFQLLDALPPEQIVIACTNLPDALDPALARRLGTRVVFGMPDAVTRGRIVNHVWRKMRARVEIEHEAAARLVDLTEGRSCDTVRQIAHAAAGRAIDAGRDEVLLEDVHAANFAMPREGKLKELAL